LAHKNKLKLPILVLRDDANTFEGDRIVVNALSHLTVNELHTKFAGLQLVSNLFKHIAP